MNAKQIKELQDKGIITALIQACHEKLTNIHTCCNKFDNGMCSYKPTDYLIKELNEIEKHTGDIRTLLGLLKNKGVYE